MEKTNAVWLKWNVDSWCFGWMLINYCWITIRIYTELFSSVRIFSIPTAVSFIKLFQKNWNVLRSRSTPSVSDTSEVSLRLNLLANIHVGTFTSDQIKRDTCGNRSRDLNQELQCGMIFGPSEKHSCQYRCLGQVLQLQGLLRDQLAVLQRRQSVWSLSVQSCAFRLGDETPLPMACCHYRGRSLVVLNNSGFRSSALTARWSDGSERLCSIFGRRSWTCSIATRIWQREMK